MCYVLDRSVEGQQFIDDECERLQALLKQYPKSAKLRWCLATFLEKRCRLTQAEEHLLVALSLAASSGTLCCTYVVC